jgi:hypothetical protein
MVLSEVLSYIYSQTTPEDVSTIFQACKERNRLLNSVRAASVTKGSKVKLTGLSPKYLNGLKGEVTEITGAKCVIHLDPSSAQKIKFTKWGSTLGVLTGVPTSTCELEV